MNKFRKYSTLLSFIAKRYKMNKTSLVI